MKRYLLFGAGWYYPNGGWDDFRGSFDCLLEAEEAATPYKEKYKWFHIVDTKNWEIVLKGE